MRAAKRRAVWPEKMPKNEVRAVSHGTPAVVPAAKAGVAPSASERARHATVERRSREALLPSSCLLSDDDRGARGRGELVVRRELWWSVEDISWVMGMAGLWVL
jgi:hypothetical protein